VSAAAGIEQVGEVSVLRLSAAEGRFNPASLGAIAVVLDELEGSDALVITGDGKFFLQRPRPRLDGSGATGRRGGGAARPARAARAPARVSHRDGRGDQRPRLRGRRNARARVRRARDA